MDWWISNCSILPTTRSGLSSSRKCRPTCLSSTCRETMSSSLMTTRRLRRLQASRSSTQKTPSSKSLASRTLGGSLLEMKLIMLTKRRRRPKGRIHSRDQDRRMQSRLYQEITAELRLTAHLKSKLSRWERLLIIISRARTHQYRSKKMQVDPPHIDSKFRVPELCRLNRLSKPFRKDLDSQKAQWQSTMRGRKLQWACKSWKKCLLLSYAKLKLQPVNKVPISLAEDVAELTRLSLGVKLLDKIARAKARWGLCRFSNHPVKTSNSRE